MTKKHGSAYYFILNHADYQGEDCLPWPFARTRGYGSFSYLGERYYAHRFMCQFVYGAPPSSKHQAAHSCGNGHLGCINPRHLSWKTKSENQLDCRGHGTAAKTRAGTAGLLTAESAQEIRDLRGVDTQRSIAVRYGISESTVSDVWLGRTWARPSKVSPWTAEDDAKLKEAIGLKMSFRRAGEYIGRPTKATENRAYRLGLKSGYTRNTEH